MIIAVEPQCRGMAHEQFNAALLYGYCIAHPGEKVVFWAESEHIRHVGRILDSAGLFPANLEFVEIEIPESKRLSKPGVMFAYCGMFMRVLNHAVEKQCNKVVFFSIYAYNLIPLKVLIHFFYKDRFILHVMMHGALDAVKLSNFSLPGVDQFAAFLKIIREKFQWNNLKLPIKPSNKYLYEKLFKISLHLFGNDHIFYYVFRDGALAGVERYLPNIRDRFRSIDLPYIFKDMPAAKTSSGRVVFATIGRGDIKAVRRVVNMLVNDLGVDGQRFEVRILGGGRFLPDLHPSIDHIGGGRILSRAEIEEYIQDVHYVLFFYDPNAYELTTSGAFFDAVAYCKPMIFLKNRCLDSYYQNYKFGYQCEDMNEMIVAMRNAMNSGDERYAGFCSEIRRMQADVSVHRNCYKLKFE
ncbi:MAG: hypothetical protein C4586_06135 [Anaerolineaceae bacterium]|nr:MAG: hypothetical protein C4586_06135 [Anaerolineaceae bacterium]